MIHPKMLFISLLLFICPLLGATEDCSLKGIDAARQAFVTKYRAKNYSEAFDRLNTFREKCSSSWVNKSESPWHESELGIVSDLALGAHRMKKDALCRELIEKAVQAPAAEKQDVLRSLIFNYKLCGCSGLPSPNPILCEQTLWEKKDSYFELVKAIHPSLQPFVFRYYPQKKILEYRSVEGKQKKKQLSLDTSNFDFTDPSASELLPSFEDMNFDGYLDLTIESLSFCGNGGCCTSPRYLFEPKKETFEKHEALSNLCYAGFNAKTKLVESCGRASCCEHDCETYDWRNGELRQIGVSVDKTAGDKKCTYSEQTVETLRGDEMKLLRKSLFANRDQCDTKNTEDGPPEEFRANETWKENLKALKGKECTKRPPDDQVFYADIDADGEEEEIIQSSACLHSTPSKDVFAVYRILPNGKRKRLEVTESSSKKIPPTQYSAELSYDGKQLIELIPLKIVRKKGSSPQEGKSEKTSLRFIYEWKKDRLNLIKTDTVLNEYK